LRKAIAFRSRRRAASKSSQLVKMPGGCQSRQITGGEVRPAMMLVPLSPRHILVRVRRVSVRVGGSI
jgi:hypothetical protein